MQRQKVSSSNITSIGYDSNLKILEIEFFGGDIYQYLNVPENVFSGIISTSSHGKYFYQFIRDKFSFRKTQ